MTQPGETDGFGVEDHLKVIFKHGGEEIVDYAVVNVGKIDKALEEKYLEDGSKLVSINEKEVEDMKVKVIKGNFVKVKNGFVRHDSEKLAAILIETIMEKKLLFDRKKIIEYFYLSRRLKENKGIK